ncbi:MAG TPA: histidine ammonia-lyase [Planctomycetes bacterium]|nr:histidine ammonia-lyase [Planctomycetota bacterium]
MKTLTLDGTSLTIEDLAPIFEGEEIKLKLDPSALERVAAARSLVEDVVEKGEPVYGLTTGFGKLKNITISREDLEELQANLIQSHCCGVGDPMPRDEVRAVQVLRINGLLRGHSGVRVELLETLVRFFQKGLVPRVPQQGSVGASGDLAPLAHMAGAYMGWGRAFVGDEELDAKEALARVGEEPLRLAAKEGLALINGTEVMAAVGAGAYLRACRAVLSADAIASLTIEALFGSPKPFDARIAALKGNPGHARTSANVRACLADSRVIDSHSDCDRVQDPYSLRCIPQVHGATKDALAHVGSILALEVNSVTDNPILFPDTGEVISAGQFHGQPLSMVFDYLAISVATIGNISERRVEQLVNPDLSHLPGFLTQKPGLNSGMMIAQVAAAALASENKVHCHPASVDTIPTSANQEDHVSMGMTAARKARTVVGNVERILGIEYLCAAQARDFHAELLPGRGALAAYELLRANIPALDRDRYLADDLERASELIRSGELLAAVEGAVGPLA